MDDRYTNGHLVQRSSKGTNNGRAKIEQQHTEVDVVPADTQIVFIWNRVAGATKFLGYHIFHLVISLFWSITSWFNVPLNMKINVKGVKTEDNIWVRADGVGYKHGFQLKKEFEDNKITTVPDILLRCVEKYGDTLCLGTRKLIQRTKVEEKNKTFEKLYLGEYEWDSYREMWENIARVAVGFHSMGFSKGSRVAILAETRASLLISIIGCLRAGISVVTLYTNLSDSGLVCGITETEIDTIITSFELLPRLKSILKDCPTIKHIIVLEDQLAGMGNTLDLPDNVNITAFSKLLASADINRLENIEKPAEHETAIIMYTSGSTGNPKGVEITHKNIVSSVLAYSVAANLSKGDTYIAFLPLAHIMELVTEISLLALGVTIAYSSPNTLTSTGTKIAKGTLGDAKVAKPTAMTAVPLILDRIIKGITQKVEKEGKFKGKIFQKAVEAKENNNKSFTSKVVDIIIFKKVKAELGGRMRMMVVGGAPLSPATHSKIRAMFGCTIQVGYGCTESAAGATAMCDSDIRTGHTGPPNFGARIKLESWEEGGYLTTDEPYPRGEIIIGGPQVAKGYFKNPEETENAFYDEHGVRWFRTGDIGMFDETGVLSVIDRRKDLVKLNNGEYVSLGSVESKLKTNCLVENICVFAEPGEDYPVAVIVPNKDALTKLAKKGGLSGTSSYEELCRNTESINLVLKEMQICSKKNGLNRWDIPKAVHLSPYIWTPDNGLVTAALKLRRRVLQKEFRQEVLDMYRKIHS